MSAQALAPDKAGQWGNTFNLLNVPVHASLLPTGKVLYWGRRWNFDPNDTMPTAMTISRLDMNQRTTKTFLWTPPKVDATSDLTGRSAPTATQPKTLANQDVSLFCSGHAFQPDGTLLVVGGHLLDSHGVNQACIYDAFKDTWTAKPIMNNGRWYPSALTLPDGGVLSISGSFSAPDAIAGQVTTNFVPQIWRNETWVNTAPPPILVNYPRLHLDPKGRVFMAGPQAGSKFLNQDGTWASGEIRRTAGEREFAPSVSYDSGKVIFIGGGNDANDNLPTDKTEIINLNDGTPTWKQTKSMAFRRRQHNATVLPDGTVLVTGGTKGNGFSNVSAGMPVHTPELWDPVTGTWTKMTDERDDRCYHSIALLLPDGQVLSAGTGEGADNPTMLSAQLFKPTYFFKAARPSITSAPAEIAFDQKTFEVTINNGGFAVKRASWIRLGSVTHSVNMNQSLIFLDCKQQGTKVTVTAPVNKNLAPPGHYMLFLLNADNLPSKPTVNNNGVPNNIIWLKPQPKSNISPSIAPSPLRITRRTVVLNHGDHGDHSLPELDSKIIKEQANRPLVTIGLTPICPYGLGACWGGALDALQRMSDIEIVRPVPNQLDSTAYVYLKQDILPDIDAWRSEFEKTANGSYHMRGIEMTLSGAVEKKREQLVLAGNETRPKLVLAPFKEGSKIEYDMWKKVDREMSEEEAGAYEELFKALAGQASGMKVVVTGRLQKNGAGDFSLDVRAFKIE
jgi:galactose oxidase